LKNEIKKKKALAHQRTSYSFLSFERRRVVEGIIFIIPWLVGFIWFVAIPLLLSVKTSFYQTKLTDMYGGKYIGFENYLTVIKQPAYGQVVVNSFLSSIYQVPVIVGFALFVAVLLKQKFPGRVYFRIIFFIPVILAGVIMTYLTTEGIGSISILSGSTSTSSTGILGIISTMMNGSLAGQIGNIMWKSSVEILIFLAALQSVPEILYEVVVIDGATAWESFWHITLPYISPFVILNCIYAMVDSFVDPSNPVMKIVNDLKDVGSFGTAAALSWMYMLMALVTILIFVLLTKRWLR